MTVQQLPSLVNRVALVAAPLLFALSALAIPALKSGDTAQLELIASHPTGWYLFTVFSLVGSAALIPASVGLMQATREAAPSTSIVGAGLLAVGGFVALADSATQLVYWQMGSQADRPQMTALLNRYENAPGANVIFMIGALALVVGAILLAVALVRAHAAPVWASVCVPVGMILNIGSFMGSSKVLLIVSSLVLLAGFGSVARRGERVVRRPAAAASVQ